VLAAARGREELVELLIRTGADINSKGYRLKTPLWVALGERKLSVAKILLEHGAHDINGEAKNILSQKNVDKDLLLAAKLNKMENLEQAIIDGANINTQDQNNESALNKALPIYSCGCCSFAIVIANHGPLLLFNIACQYQLDVSVNTRLFASMICSRTVYLLVLRVAVNFRQ